MAQKTKYIGPEIIRARDRTQLGFVVPVKSSDSLIEAIRIANRTIENAMFTGRVDVSPSVGQAHERHAHPGLCIYVAVPAEETLNPLDSKTCVIAKRIVGEVCDAIAA